MSALTELKDDLMKIAKGQSVDSSFMNEKIRKEILYYKKSKKVLERENQIAEELRKEREQYEIDKKEFYDNPLHWSNNKRRMHGLPTLRGSTNKHRSTKFHAFRPTSRMFFLIEDIITETIEDGWDDYFNKFIDVKDIKAGKAVEFYTR